MDMGQGRQRDCQALKELSHEGISKVIAVSNLISTDLFPVQSTLKKELNQVSSQSSDSHVLHP